MEIFIEDIPEEGLTIKADTAKDSWLLSAVKESIGERFGKEGKARLVVTFIKFEENVDVRGEITLSWHPTCDRCLKVFAEKRKLPFHMTMAPLYESERQREDEKEFEKELVHDDLEFSYYEGDRINLSEIVREQILLDEPVKHLCSDDCKGICQKCGKDLNEGPCNCKEEHRDPRWDVLKKFKPARKATRR